MIRLDNLLKPSMFAREMLHLTKSILLNEPAKHMIMVEFKYDPEDLKLSLDDFSQKYIEPLAYQLAEFIKDKKGFKTYKLPMPAMYKEDSISWLESEGFHIQMVMTPDYYVKFYVGYTIEERLK